ncbi:MAG: hypothetical protein IJN31_00890 [Peptococcaceae bacterium]|nr:hypothetical protein [Peptococcaceae bacterium]
MWIDVVKFGQNCAFSQDAIDALMQAESKLEENNSLSIFLTCREQLFLGKGDPWKQINALADEKGVHRFAVHQLFLIYCAEETGARYEKAGYSENLY